MGRCEKCLNRVPVMSENGLHYNCGLSEREALECLTKAKDHSVMLDLKLDENAKSDLKKSIEDFYDKE